ncbi:hypothetical protein EYC98_03185 [Halieaceae bacterium IMCC14734]|uniref:VPLPA-CTERM sorting domain-containing protein n=1 Tax=Candidatus Litorirhabdus singularis TaxID=2518993 RepID=A0ABT3TC71_9GAMM|nr:hypothetical protein [Candidatus Litorirhabdus singularis]MCX2979863.1 hypothetical protein [Candidatus Litorirhabdus singularis]
MSDYKVGTAIATFGVATASLYMTPSAEAAVIDLTPNPASITQGSTSSAGTLVELGIPGGNADLFQYNGLIAGDGDPINFNAFTAGSFSISGSNYVYDIAGFRTVSVGGTVSVNDSFAISRGRREGIRYWGFLTRDNNVGWFKVDLGTDSDNTIRYLDGAWEDTEDSIRVGEVPLPASLPLLASALGLLAAGATRKRTKTAANV